MSIQVDLKHLNGFVQSQEMEGIAPQVKMAHHMLHNGTGMGNDYIGWLNLPTDYDKEEMCIRDRVLPLALLRPISGSGSTAVLTEIFQNYGADGFIGRVASVMMGSTETTFYAIAVYFGSVGIKKTRHAIPAALMADTTGYIMSVLAVNLFFR